MVIDCLITGTKINAIEAAAEFENGQPTGKQKTRGGVPVWSVEVGIKDGEYLLPLRVKLTAPVAPQTGTRVKFVGVEVSAWNGSSYFSAQSFEYIRGEDELSELLGGDDVQGD